jgi:4-hydroxy-tetrahydrodipicolinate reductase
MSRIKIAISGASGKMGRELDVISRTKDFSFQVTHQIGRTNLAKTFKGQFEADVIIDFSNPQFTMQLLQKTKDLDVGLVIGTTGFNETQLKKISAAAKTKRVFYSANMSLGVAALRKAMQVFNYLSDFDFQIVEFHHNQKKDNPSGTALMLQKALPKSSKSKQPVGVRGGGIFGIHNVYAMSESEIIEFSHTALNRQVFAKGAVKVAKWLHEQKPGRLYTFEDYF